jgi:iron complex transport system substrate-binding protein
MKRPRIAGGAAAAIVAAAFVAIGLAAAPAPAPVQNASPAPPTRDFTDELGRAVRIVYPPRRIVSLAPNLTETLYALGVEDRVAAVTNYCDYPPAARAKPRVGGAINPSLEAIVAAEPDLVLLTWHHNRRETAEALDGLRLPYYVVRPQTVEGIIASVERLGTLTGSARTAEVVAEMRARLEALETRLAGRTPRRVLFVVWDEPLISIGPLTFLADALRRAGAVSVVETRQDWPRLSLEEILRLQPDFLIFASNHSASLPELARTLAERPGWRRLRAVETGHIALVSDAINRPAPRMLEAVEALARTLHPDAFEECETRSLKIETRASNLARRHTRFGGVEFRVSSFEFRRPEREW